MSKKTSLLCLILFVSFSFLELYSHFFKMPNLHQFVKPLLMPTLLAYFWLETQKKPFKSTGWVLLALLFSFFGDTLLMFDSRHSLYFVLGLGMFLFAHIFYIVFFIKKAKFFQWKKMYAAIFLIGIYGGALLWFLHPYLGEMRIAVWVYAFTIMLMLLSAYNLYTCHSSAFWVLLGAMLFVLSDSLIAINKFALDIPQAQFLVMLTYILAQWLIVRGILITQWKD